MKVSDARTLKFQRLRLENWRNFASVDVPLQSRVFLVGPNACGKSNFLDVFRFLHDIVSVGGGFAEAVGLRRGGVTKLRSLLARRYSDVVVHVHVGSDDQPSLWEYELQFSQDNQRRPLIKKERVAREHKDLWTRPGDEDREDPERLIQTYLEQINVNKDFREVVDFFRSVRYLHVVPQLVREPDRSAAKTDDPYGGDFLEQIAKTPERTRNAWLRRIQDALRGAVPQLKDMQFYRDEVRGTPHLRGNYVHWRPRGAWQNEDQFSDGTLRLLGLLWAALEGSGPLLLEEPELSLHPDVVTHIPQMFARMQSRTGRQVILSTHSPSMLQDAGIGLDEVLLLTPEREGTSVRLAKDYRQVVELLEGGLSMAEAVLPYTRPADAEQLSLFPAQP
jgi:predicted ATPase